MELVYNNAKNVSIGQTSFELNYGYHPHISFKDNINFYLRSHPRKKLVKKLKNLISICQ